MVVLIDKQRWLTKPSYPVEVDPKWAGEFIGGAAYVYGNGQEYDLLTGIPVASNTATLSVNHVGTGRATTVAASSSIGTRNLDLKWVSPGALSDPFSLVIGFAPAAFSATCCLFGQRDSNNTGGYFYLTTDKKMGFVHNNVAAYTITNALALSAGASYTFGMSHGGANTAVDFYHQGRFIETKSVGNWANPFSAETLRVGYNGTDAKSEGIFQFAYILRKRRISAALQHILGTEPYAILRPRRVVLYYSFKSAAAGGDVWAGGTAGVATVTATLTGLFPLQGGTAGTGTVTARLSGLFPLQGGTAGVATVTGTLRYDAWFKGGFAGSSNVGAFLTGIYPLNAGTAGAGSAGAYLVDSAVSVSDFDPVRRWYVGMPRGLSRKRSTVVWGNDGLSGKT